MNAKRLILVRIALKKYRREIVKEMVDNANFVKRSDSSTVRAASAMRALYWWNSLKEVDAAIESSY